MSRKQRRRREKRHRHVDQVRLSRGRVAVGTGLSLGAALGMTATAEAVEFTVTNTAPTGGGSLSAAITSSQQGNAPTLDQIVFQSGLSGAITLTSELPLVTEPLQIVGPGATTLTVSGNNTSRILSTNSGGYDVTISGLTLSGGNSGALYGGGIYANGDLIIRNSTISGNTTTSFGGGVFHRTGGLTIENSTFSGNTASGGLGAGFRSYMSSSVAVKDSTISGNLAGTGVSLRFQGGSTFEGSTITNNPGAGIYGSNSTNPVLTSTLVANNAGADLGSGGASPPNFELAFSLIENPSAVTLIQTGPNVLGSDPQLGSLAANGGATQTQLPATASPAIDKGSDTGTDQRGLARPFDVPSLGNAAGGNGADIGAVELQSSSFPAAVPPPQTPAKKKCKKKKKKKRSAASAKKCKKKKKK